MQWLRGSEVSAFASTSVMQIARGLSQGIVFSTLHAARFPLCTRAIMVKTNYALRRPLRQDKSRLFVHLLRLRALCYSQSLIQLVGMRGTYIQRAGHITVKLISQWYAPCLHQLNCTDCILMQSVSFVLTTLFRSYYWLYYRDINARVYVVFA